MTTRPIRPPAADLGDNSASQERAGRGRPDRRPAVTLVCCLTLIVTLALTPRTGTAVADGQEAGTPMAATTTATTTPSATPTATTSLTTAPLVKHTPPPEATAVLPTATSEPATEAVATDTATPIPEPPTVTPTSPPTSGSPSAGQRTGKAPAIEEDGTLADADMAGPAASPDAAAVGSPESAVTEAPAVTVTALAEEDAAYPGGTVALRYRLTNASDATALVVPVATNSLPRWTAEVYTADGITPIAGPIAIPPANSVEVVVLVRVPPEARLDDRNTTTLDAVPAVTGD